MIIILRKDGRFNYVCKYCEQRNTYLILLLFSNHKLAFIGKSRRAQANFPGAKVILEQIASKPTRRRVGFLSTGPPARGQ